MDHTTVPTQAAQTAVQRQMPQPPSSQLSQPFQPVVMLQQVPRPTHPQSVRQALPVQPPQQPPQQPHGFQEQRHLATHISPHIPPHISPHVQQHPLPVSKDILYLHRLFQPVQQPAVEGQQAPDMAHGASNIQHPAQSLPPQRQSMEPAVTDPRGGLEHPFPVQISRQDQAKEEYWRLNSALVRCLPESLQCAVRQNWERCLNGTDFHQMFMLKSLLMVISPAAARSAFKEFGSKAVRSAKAEIVAHLRTSDIDKVAGQILAQASEKFLDAALDIRLRSIDAKRLVNALARAERLGYEIDGVLAEPDPQRESAVLQELHQGLDQQQPLPVATASPPRQCAVCSRLYTTESAYIDHVTNQVCMPRPVNGNGPALSCIDCGQSFEHACDLNHHTSKAACKKAGPVAVYKASSKTSSETGTTANDNASKTACSTASRTDSSKTGSNSNNTDNGDASTTASITASITASGKTGVKTSGKIDNIAKGNASKTASCATSSTANSESNSNESNTGTDTDCRAASSTSSHNDTSGKKDAYYFAASSASFATSCPDSPARRCIHSGPVTTIKQIAGLHKELLQCEETLTERLQKVKNIADPVQRRTRLGNLKQSFTSQRSAIREKYGVLQSLEQQSPSEGRRQSISRQKLTSSSPNKRTFDDLHPISTTTDLLRQELSTPAVKRARTEGDIRSGSRSASGPQTTLASQGRRQETVTKSSPIPINKPRAEQLPLPLAVDDDDTMSDSSSDDDDIPARLPDLVLQSLSSSQR
ncbi:hypothetical protein SEPCBS57363_000304 [Sporothrix epigloea]|uniref:C2H2-type domain-containing protein n=1 Tax=Sporothrix epigloea TaxID=1892477 RepID=A0ABP0D3Z9_9PEZI